MTTLTQQDGIHVLNIGADENRFSPQWLDQVEGALDAVVSEPAPLVTIADGKFFSNGLDLDYLGANPDHMGVYVARVESVFARVLALPVPTVAAVNGHAFGAGAMLAMAHDSRIMRADRGYFCFPEVDIQIPFTPGMAALIQSKLTPRAAIDSMTTGRRFAGPEALATGLVDATADEAELLSASIAHIAPLSGKPANTLGAIKSTMYATALAHLTREGH